MGGDDNIARGGLNALKEQFPRKRGRGQDHAAPVDAA